MKPWVDHPLGVLKAAFHAPASWVFISSTPWDAGVFAGAQYAPLVAQISICTNGFSYHLFFLRYA